MLKDNVVKDETKNEETINIITPGQLVMRRFLRNKLAIAGLVMLITMFLSCVLGPFFSPYGEYEMFYQMNGEEILNPSEIDMAQTGIKLFDKQSPSSRHWLGTDRDGRDMLTRLMYGGRISLLIGLICVIIEIVLGMTLGGISGYYGGWVDMLVMRIVDIFNCIPTLPVVLLAGVAMRTLKLNVEFRIYILMLIIGFLGWTGVARITRGQILSLREQEFMLATEATGLKVFRRIFKHLLPNVMPQLIVIATLGIGQVILLEAWLSYLGLGVPLPYASWGNMVNVVGDSQIMINNPSMWIPPGLCILVTVMAFNFLGDGLRDAFDPKMKR